MGFESEMLMLTVRLLILAYLMSLAIMYLVARSAIKDRVWRMTFCLFGIVLPFLIVFVVIKHIFSPKPARLNYVPEVAAVEDAIEQERTQIFGGEILWPSFSEHWKRSCQLEMQRVVLWSDRTTKRLNQIRHHFSIKPV